MRLGDLADLKTEILWGNVNLSDKESNELIDLIDDQPTIDPETLPIVKKLRAELEKVKAERDAAVKDCSGYCDTCAFEKDCAKHDKNDSDIMHWYYGDCEDWQWRGVQEGT